MTSEDRGAEFSDDGLHRYRLWRIWGGEGPTLTFVMLNPSTADAEKNDATVERCERRARSGGYSGLIVVNTMALCSTSPGALYGLNKELLHDASEGPNAAAVEWALAGDTRVICGWGNHAHRLDVVDPVIDIAKRLGTSLYCLKKNGDGSPGHPLYIPYSASPIWWGGEPDKIPIA